MHIRNHACFDGAFTRAAARALGLAKSAVNRALSSLAENLEPGIVVFKIYNGYCFFGRPTIEELRQDLRVVLRKCRPDSAVTSPELKADWKRGAHNGFYPYGKTYGQVFQEQE
jgi:hypothetical protein